METNVLFVLLPPFNQLALVIGVDRNQIFNVEEIGENELSEDAGSGTLITLGLIRDRGRIEVVSRRGCGAWAKGMRDGSYRRREVQAWQQMPVPVSFACWRTRGVS